MKIPIVNGGDSIINYTEIENLDKRIEGIFRISALWIIDQDQNVLLSRLAEDETKNAGLWTSAFVSIVIENET